MPGGGTTDAGSFRYPYEYSSVFAEIREILIADRPDVEAAFDNYVALQMDRDRALEDYSTAGYGGGEVFWDALVDNSQDTDESALRFAGIFEAVDYMVTTYGVSRSHIIAVKNTHTEYVETASIGNFVTTIHIVGLCDFNANHTSNQGGTGGIEWDHANFNFSASTLSLSNFSISSTGETTDLFNGSGSIWATNVDFNPINISVGCSRIDAFRCRIQGGPCLGWSAARLERCDIRTNNATYNISSGGTWELTDTSLGDTVGTNSTIAFPSGMTLISRNSFGGRFSGTLLTPPTVTFGNLATARISAQTAFGSLTFAANPASIHLDGFFNEVTIASAGATRTVFNGSATRVDITGPAQLNLQLEVGNGQTCFLRGNNIQGNIALRGQAGSSSITMTLASLINSHIVYSAWNNVGGDSRPLLVDSGCSGVLVDLTGESTWTVPYINNGTNCLVRTVDGVPPSGPAGGDLTGTYPNPSVRALAFLTTKGDLAAGPAGVRLPVGSDGSILVPDSGETLGLKWAPAYSNLGDSAWGAGSGDVQRVEVGRDQRLVRAQASAAGGVSWDYQRTLKNKLTANQASLETDTAGWTAESGCTIARNAANASHGSACLAITKS